MLVPVWIVGGFLIFIYKQLHCTAMPAANTFEGNLNLLIILLFGIYYIYADTEKMRIIDKNIYIGIVSVILIFILFVVSTFLIVKPPKKDVEDKEKKLIESDNLKKPTPLCGHCYKDLYNIAWFIVYISMTTTLILYFIFYDTFGLISWLTLFITYMVLVICLCLFRRNNHKQTVLILSIISMIMVIITVGVEFIFQNVCMEISPKRYIYPVLAGVLVITIRFSKHFTNDLHENRIY